uniref:Fucosyltransferase n=1 Tax=Steinernema glaseri TaxID=37863 RepID=A0A1I7YPX8_9BILA
MDDFSSPKAMGKHLDYLMKNRTAYMEYFKWRNDGWKVAYAVERYEGRHMGASVKGIVDDHPEISGGVEDHRHHHHGSCFRAITCLFLVSNGSQSSASHSDNGMSVFDQTMRYGASEDHPDMSEGVDCPEDYRLITTTAPAFVRSRASSSSATDLSRMQVILITELR